MELELDRFAESKSKQAYTNCLYLNKKNKIPSKYVEIGLFIFKICYKSFVPLGKVITNNTNRIQIGINYGQKVTLKEYYPDKIDNIQKIEIILTCIDDNTEQYSLIDFKIMFDSLFLEYLNKNQDYISKIGNHGFKLHVDKLFSTSSEIKRGKVNKSTEILFISDKININTPRDIDLSKINLLDYGIGGMNSEFQEMVRLVFLSRTIEPEEFEKLGVRHQKGIIIHGPSGTGKTSLARAISKMITNVKPIIVNGPEILNKFVGQSEANIRSLFSKAEVEFKLKGIYSDLHVIIFDEFDAIARKRTNIPNSSTNVSNNVVNQLLTMIDGVETLNNILVIGITNRFELLDEAILRPGRFGIHIEIPLPNYEGRLQIFKIHTKGLLESGMLDNSVDIRTLAIRTKNYTGAEIENLIQRATSYALERKTQINQNDFLNSIFEIQTKYGSCNPSIPNMFMYNRSYITLIKELSDYISNFGKNKYLNFSTILIEGNIGSGKTTLVSKIILESDFSFSRILNSEKLLTIAGDYNKSMYINSTFSDAEKSDKSIIILDNIEQIVEINSYLSTVSKDLLHTLKTLLNRKPKNNKLLVIGTTSSKEYIKRLGLLEIFDTFFQVPLIENVDIPNIISSLNLSQAKSMFPEKFTIKDLLTILGNTEQYKVDQACQKYFYRYKTQL